MTPEQFSQLKVGDRIRHNMTDKPLVVTELHPELCTVTAILHVTVSKASSSVWQRADITEVPKDATLPV